MLWQRSTAAAISRAWRPASACAVPRSPKWAASRRCSASTRPPTSARSGTSTPTASSRPAPIAGCITARRKRSDNRLQWLPELGAIAMSYSRRELLMLAGHLGMGSALLPWQATAQPNRANPFLEHGYAPVLDELSVDNLVVRGEVPREISGTYLRNGPNPAYPPISYTYPFDGDGMVHGLTFDGGKV